MVDNDTNLSPDALAVVEPLITALNNDAMTTIEHLVADADAKIATDWWMTQNDGGAVEFLKAHDAAWAEREGAPAEHSVAPGYYVNGELEERPGESTPPAKFDDLPDTGHGIGQWASLGGNESINAALIADIGEGVRTMVVMGDYYKTDAMFQTNTIVDKDEVHVSGGEGKPSLTSEGNSRPTSPISSTTPASTTDIRPKPPGRTGSSIRWTATTTASTRCSRPTISPTTMLQRRSAAVATTTWSAATISSAIWP